MSTFLTLKGIECATLDLLPSAIEVRNKLVGEASSILVVSDAMDADAATAVLRDITAQIKICETTRTDIKGPVLELTRKIDGTAKEFAAPLEAEKTRLSRIIGAYQQAEREKAEKARREAAEEAQRIAREEAKKIAAAEIEHGADSEEAQAAQNKAADKVAEARVAVANASAVQPAGTAVKKTWKFLVEDINALAASHPELVVVTANTAAINAILKHNQSIAGLRVWQDVQTIIR
jgi:hypothetical protein